ncbi:hypothetical protein N0V93_007786 [Gnomoniopsis smithogilvyi]|uniref:Glycoside hydrolase n=1 Tax=Gnomoniopsis smithogilvyi TaxID=1191159 RepID=A0A9W9CU57_9PEZI|nr:hypothetical protein N0V93_007786 [Gnomoniopsis smithogilvyi]
MSGIVQELPSEATGAAVGVFIYSFICFSLSVGLLWATVAHREWKSYVAMLAFYTSLATLASMAQQLHTYLRWTSIKLAQYDYVRANLGNPELSVAGPSVGVDIVLFYIQFYCYNAEAILVVAWCTQLAYSVYQLQPTRSVSRYGSYTAKLTAVFLPAVQCILLRTDALQHSLVGFYFVANIIMGFSLAVGIVLLLAILAKYVSTRAEVSWHVRYADRSSINEAVGHDASLASFTSASGAPLHMKSIYDNWLVVRFTIAFAGLAAYQLVIIASEINFALGNDETASETTVNLHASHAITDIKSFLPGVSACILAFIVFGTTKAFRDYFYHKLVPRSIRRKIRNRKSKSPSLTIQFPRGASTAALRSPGRSPGMARSPASECFEMDGGESGLGTERSNTYELSAPTPTYQSTFDVQHKDGYDDIWPGPNMKPRK